jgi:hypothetical protein
MIEDLIRAAQEEQARRAVPESRVLAGLPALRRRRRRLVLLGAGVTAAAAAVVPVVVLAGPPAVAPVPLSPAAAPSVPATGPSVSAVVPPVAASLPAQVALGYRPGWVPAGFAEYVRQADIGDDDLGPTLVRVWRRSVGAGDPWGEPGGQLDFYVRTDVTDPAAAVYRGGEKVDVNGADGWYSPAQGDKKSSLTWIAGDDTVLMLATSRLDLRKADLLRVARSVRPDPGVTTNPVRLRWLPDGWSAAHSTVSGPSAGRWRASVNAVTAPPVTASLPAGADKGEGGAEGGRDRYGDVTVTVGESAEAPDGGRELTVAGRPAREPVRADEAGKGLRYLVVELGSGRVMTLVGSGAGLSAGDLVRIAEGAEVTPAGLEWLGR